MSTETPNTRPSEQPGPIVPSDPTDPSTDLGSDPTDPGGEDPDYTIDRGCKTPNGQPVPVGPDAATRGFLDEQEEGGTWRRYYNDEGCRMGNVTPGSH